jgi:hypothetical protein
MAGVQRSPAELVNLPPHQMGSTNTVRLYIYFSMILSGMAGDCFIKFENHLNVLFWAFEMWKKDWQWQQKIKTVTSCRMWPRYEPVQATVSLLHFYIFCIIYCDFTLAAHFYKEERPLLHVANNSANKDWALVRDSNAGLPYKCQGPPAHPWLYFQKQNGWPEPEWSVCASMVQTWTWLGPHLRRASAGGSDAAAAGSVPEPEPYEP